MMEYFYKARKRDFRKRGNYIVKDVISQASVMILLEKRLEIYTQNGFLAFPTDFIWFSSDKDPKEMEEFEIEENDVQGDDQEPVE